MSAERRRELILDAALEVFAARGPNASIDEVAQAAGVSKALIYEHFPSKQDLRVSLFELHAGELLARLAANAESAAPGEDRLRSGVDAVLAFVEERRIAWRLLFRETVDPEMGARLERVRAQVADFVAVLGAAEPPVGDEPEDERAVSIQMVAQLLTGAVQTLANWWVDHPEVPRRRVLEAVMEFAWIGLERVRAGERATPG